MPGKAEALWSRVGWTGDGAGDTDFVTAERIDCSGWRVSKGEGLFPRPEPVEQK